MKTRFWLAAALLGLLAGTAQADVVHLKNGRTIRGANIEVDATHVRITFPGGSIRLERQAVQRVEGIPEQVEQVLRIGRSARVERRHAEQGAVVLGRAAVGRRTSRTRSAPERRSVPGNARRPSGVHKAETRSADTGTGGAFCTLTP